jgi:fluoroquinolone transport system permease protein
MTWMGLICRLIRSDARLLLRDRLLVVLLCVVVIVGVVARFGLPLIDAALADSGTMPSASTTLRFADTYPLWIAFIGLWQAALMPGTVFGFMLLDEKEADTLTVMQVTPVPLRRYLGYRVALPWALAVVFGLVLTPVLEPLVLELGHDGGDPPGVLARVAIVLGAAMVAPITTLLLATFAANKVQGLAFTKFAGVAGLLILIGWFVPAPWQWALAGFPPFLVAKAYWMVLAGEGGWGLVLGAGIVAELGLLGWLVVRFRELAVR